MSAEPPWAFSTAAMTPLARQENCLSLSRYPTTPPPDADHDLQFSCGGGGGGGESILPGISPLGNIELDRC